MSKLRPRFSRTNPQLPTISVAVYQLLMSGLIDGQRWILDLGLLSTSSSQTASSEANLMSSWLASSAYLAFVHFMASDVTGDMAKISCVSAPTRQPYVQNGGGAAFAGSVVGGHYNSELAAVLSKYTAIKGQHGRGRNYVPGIPISFITTGSGADPNHLNSTGMSALTAIQTALLAMSLADGATTSNLCVYTRPPKGQPVTQAALVTQIVSRNLIGTVRRRRIGRGK